MRAKKRRGVILVTKKERASPAAFKRQIGDQGWTVLRKFQGIITDYTVIVRVPCGDEAACAKRAKRLRTVSDAREMADLKMAN